MTGGRLLVVRHAENGLGVSRWGFAVGKRIAKKAAVRNRVRRRLRECGRLLTVRGGVDLIVSARGGAVEASFQELREELERALGRARLLEAAPAA